MATLSIKNPNDPRAIRTRKMLVEALFELMFQRRWEDITVQEIADKATLNRATFYAHFRDKDSLLEYSADASFREDLESRLRESTSARDLPAVLLTAVGEHLRRIHQHCSETKTPMESFEPLLERRIKLQLHEILSSGATGSMRRIPSGASDRSSTAAAWAIYGLGRQWAHEPGRVPLKAFLEEAVPLVECILDVSAARA